MIRSWGVVTLGSAAQPWFGDALTAAVGLPGPNGEITVTVASTTRYRAGDRIVLDPEQTNQDILLVDSIRSATILLCRSEGGATTHTHSSSALVQLSISCMDVLLQSLDGNTAAIWLGTDNTVTTSGGGSGFHQLQKVASAAIPTEFRESNSGTYNVCRTSDGWMVGTSGDKVAVSATVL